MTKRSRLPRSRHHIFVYDEDWQWLTSRYSGVPIGPGAACCEIIHLRIRAMRQREIDLAEQCDAGTAGATETEPREARNVE